LDAGAACCRAFTHHTEVNIVSKLRIHAQSQTLPGSKAAFVSGQTIHPNGGTIVNG